MEQPPPILRFGAALTGLWVLWHYAVKPHIARRFRFRLTQYQVELAKLAQDGVVDPDSRSYHLLHKMLTGYQSTNGQVSVMRAVVPILVKGIPSSNEAKEAMSHLFEVAEGNRGTVELQDFTRRLSWSVSKFILARSLLTTGVLCILLPLAFVGLVIVALLSRLSSFTRRVQIWAFQATLLVASSNTTPTPARQHRA